MIKTTDSVTLQNDKEKIDPRGRTPLMLAVRLANLACVKCLLAAKCNFILVCIGGIAPFYKSSLPLTRQQLSSFWIFIYLGKPYFARFWSN